MRVGILRRVSAIQCLQVDSQLPPGVPWSGSGLGAHGLFRILKHTHFLLRTSAGDAKKYMFAVKYCMLSGVKCNPGPASGLAADPRYPLLSQGHRAPWASQIIKHTHFLLKTIPRSEKFLLNVGMLSAVKCHPGPSSGPTSCPRCPLKWQGHHGPWAEPHSQAYPTSCSKQC